MTQHIESADFPARVAGFRVQLAGPAFLPPRGRIRRRDQHLQPHHTAAAPAQDHGLRFVPSR